MDMGVCRYGTRTSGPKTALSHNSDRGEIILLEDNDYNLARAPLQLPQDACRPLVGGRTNLLSYDSASLPAR